MTTDETDQLCSELRQIVRQRTWLMQTLRPLESQRLAISRAAVGYTKDMPTAEKTIAMAQADLLLTHLDRPDQCDDETVQRAAAIAGEVLRSLNAGIRPLNQCLAAVEKALKDKAARLPKPVIDFVEATPGLGLIGLGVIIGEAGPLDRYASKSRLWRRFALAVVDGRAQRLQKGKEESKRQGFCARRRRVIWMTTKSVICRKGKYYDSYLARKLIEGQKTTVKAHADAMARRYISKQLLRDLWQCWTGTKSRSV